MTMRLCVLVALLMGVQSLPCRAEPAGPPPVWDNVPVFPQTPLEARLGVFRVQPNPDVLAMILWNDGSNNRLDAVRIPPPYDGTGVTSTPLENTATLFALGDICTTANAVVVPYIKDFNVEVARFDGSTWQTNTVPGTTTNNFDSSDCVHTAGGLIIAGHDLTDSETELFRSTNQGSDYTFYGRYSNVAGPFDGAVREPLATTFGQRYVIGGSMTTSGQYRVTRIDTQQTPPTITQTPVRTFAPPSGFSFVREAAIRCLSQFCFITYNQDQMARAIEVPVDNPALFTDRVLGPVSNTGSQFTFQGGSLLPIAEQDGQVDAQINALWGDYFLYDPTMATPPATDPDYPLIGVGGPTDTCLRQLSDGSEHVAVLGPRVGGAGTDLYFKSLPAPPIFTDGFESGDVSTWTSCN